MRGCGGDNTLGVQQQKTETAFITNFELFLHTEKDCGSTTMLYMMPLQRMITTAINNGWLPFLSIVLNPKPPIGNF